MKKEINWSQVQEFYNDNHTWRDIMNEFTVSNQEVNDAKKKGLLIFRTRGEAMKLARIKYPLKLSEKTKKLISEKRKAYLKEHPDQVPYLLNHYSKGESYPEKYFNEILTKSGLVHTRFLQISVYNLDFAFVDKGINLEIDGNQHYLDKRILESNIERDKFLSELGWKVVRILWSDFQRMKQEEKVEYVQKLIEFLQNSEMELPKIIDNNHYCECGQKMFRTSKRCIKCHNLHLRTVIRPDINFIIEKVKESTYVSVGKKYGVSGNCIKKWIIKSGNVPPKKQGLIG